MVEIFGILFLTIVAPLWIILHYVTGWKRSKTLTGEDEKMLEELYGVAARMEDRIVNLEKILDADDKGWRRSVRED